MSADFFDLINYLIEIEWSLCNLYFPTNQFPNTTDSLIPANIPGDAKQCNACHLKNEHDEKGNFKKIPESEKKCIPTCEFPGRCQQVANLQKEIIPIPDETLFEINVKGLCPPPVSQFGFHRKDKPWISLPIPTFFSSALKKAADEQKCELMVHVSNCILISEKPCGAYWIHLLKYILIEGQEYDAFFDIQMRPVKVKIVDGVLLMKY
jgi:hypothetical protein